MSPRRRQIGFLRAESTLRALFCASAVGVGIDCGPVLGQGGACYYEVTVLDLIENCNIAGGPSSTTPLAIADNGWITGQHPQCNGSGLSWVMMHTEGTAVEDLIPPFANVTNAVGHHFTNSGLIVGYFDSSTQPRRGFLYDDNTGQWEEVPTVTGGHMSELISVNESGVAVGAAGNTVTGPSPLAVIWDDGVLIDLWASLPSTTSEARDITDTGVIVGWHGSSSTTDARAFIHDGTLNTLDAIPGGYTSEGIAINESGDVFVFGRVTDPTHGYLRRGYIWRDGAFIPLGILPGFLHMIPQDIAEDGTVVGWCQSTETSQNAREAFIWRDGVLSNLDELIDPALEFDTSLALSINTHGDITGVVSGPSLEATSAFIARRSIPTDLDHDCTTGVTDLLFVLLNWGSQKSSADVNRDGLVDILDLLMILASWG